MTRRHRARGRGRGRGGRWIAWRLVLGLVGVVTSACSSENGPGRATTVVSDDGVVQLSIELAHTEVVAGTPIEGVLVFENSGEPVDVLLDGCAPIWGVGLTDDELEPSVAFTVPCLTEPLHIPTGRSEVPITVSTRYASCVGDDPVPAGEVRCSEGGGVPALPAGTYTTALVVLGGHELGGPDPAPVTVTLTG